MSFLAGLPDPIVLPGQPVQTIDRVTIMQAIDLAAARARLKALEEEVCAKIGHRLDDPETGEVSVDLIGDVRCARCEKNFEVRVAKRAGYE